VAQVKCLVTGGAGYIGSHIALALLARGDDVIVLDNLSAGWRALVPREATFIEGDVGDRSLLRQVLVGREIDAILHFAGSVVVPESVANPLAYYANNTVAALNLIASCIEHGVNRFVFSSTAAVYGIPQVIPVSESAATSPINPYGRSKLMVEWMLEDAVRAHAFRYVALRYFNVAGADPELRSGQSTRNATHLIKRACQAAVGNLERLEVFGTDFPTPDGTGVRDYIHVSDLVSAHVLALEYLERGGESFCANAGYGHGFSVLEVIRAVERAAGRKLDVRLSPRREGDPPALVADPAMLMQRLGWRPKHQSLDEIVETALGWERRLAELGSGRPG
jgi:UDP-glucose 4-epimerase